VLILLEMAPDLFGFSLIDSLAIDLPHPILGNPLFDVKLNLPILDRLLTAIPLELDVKFVILTSLQHVLNIGHLIRRRLFLI